MSIRPFITKSGADYTEKSLPPQNTYCVRCSIYIGGPAKDDATNIKTELFKGINSEKVSKIQTLWLETLSEFTNSITENGLIKPFKGCYGIAVAIHENTDSPKMENMTMGKVTRDLTLFHAMQLQSLFVKFVKDST